MTKTTTNAVAAATSRLETIRSVALRLFVDQGYQAVSLRQLAEQTGLQVGSLYHYIESKQGLLFDFIEEHEYRLLQGLGTFTPARLDPRSAVGHYLAAYLRFTLPRREWHLLSLRERHCLELAQQAKIQGLRDQQMQILKNIIASGMAQKHFQVDDFDFVVEALRAMLDGTVLGPLGHGLRTEMLIKRLQQMTLRSLLVCEEARA